jgi:hypothetical protein
MVAELLSTDGDMTQMFHPDLVWVEVTEIFPRPHAGWHVISDGVQWKFTDAAIAETLADAKVRQAALVNAAAEDELAALTAAYPNREIATWSQQLAEAQAFMSDPEVSTPMLSAISAGCGISVAELASTVTTRSAEYLSACGAVVGKRVALMARIDRANSPSEIQSITWSDAE